MWIGRIKDSFSALHHARLTPFSFPQTLDSVSTLLSAQISLYLAHISQARLFDLPAFSIWNVCAVWCEGRYRCQPELDRCSEVHVSKSPSSWSDSGLASEDDTVLGSVGGPSWRVWPKAWPPIPDQKYTEVRPTNQTHTHLVSLWCILGELVCDTNDWGGEWNKLRRLIEKCQTQMTGGTGESRRLYLNLKRCHYWRWTLIQYLLAPFRLYCLQQEQWLTGQDQPQNFSFNPFTN